MASLNQDLLDGNTRTSLSRAADIMRSFAKGVLMPEATLLALLRMPDSTAYRALTRLSVSSAFALRSLENEVETQLRSRIGRGANFTFLTDANVPVELTDEMLIVLDEARSIAMASGEIYIGTEDLLGAMAQPGVSTAGLLQKRGVTPATISALVTDGRVSKRTTLANWVAQAQRGQLPPLFPREALLRELVSILSLSADRHIFLVGSPGCGRRSLAQSLALMLVNGAGSSQTAGMPGSGSVTGLKPPALTAIIEVSDIAWLDNPTSALQVGLRQAQGGVLFVSNIHRFFARDPRLDAASKELLKLFADDTSGVIVIGTTTDQDYTERIKDNAILSQHSHTLRVPAASTDECVKMLTALRAQFERDYDVHVDDSAIKSAATLAGRFIGDSPLPGSATAVLNRACAVARGSTLPAAARTVIDSDDVTLAISIMTGIPASKLGSDERTKYAAMTQTLEKRIIGQDDAVIALSRAVKAARIGLKDPKRPIGSFLFLGPSGTGKTETARALAEFMFGSEDQLIALDMTEYQKDDTINRLIGSPPGYIGSESGGQLTEKVLKTPYAVVLFDEVEKAHPRILDILLQIMEEGRLTDGKGRVANFSETVVLLTSNLGAQFLNDPSLGSSAAEMAMGEVRGFFRPEFLNRLDDIIMFKPLGPDSLATILNLMIQMESKMAADRGITMDVTPAARAWMLSQNEHPEWGARPLRRILQRNVRDRLADFLLTQEAPPPRISVDANKAGSALEFKVLS